MRRSFLFDLEDGNGGHRGSLLHGQDVDGSGESIYWTRYMGKYCGRNVLGETARSPRSYPFLVYRRDVRHDNWERQGTDFRLLGWRFPNNHHVTATLKLFDEIVGVPEEEEEDYEEDDYEDEEGPKEERDRKNEL